MITKRVGAETIRLYDLTEASEILGTSERTTRQYLYDGLIPSVRLKRRLYITDRNLSAFLRGASSTKRKKRVEPPKYEVDDYPADPWESP